MRVCKYLQRKLVNLFGLLCDFMKKFNIGLLIIGLCFGGFYVYKHVVGNVGCKISKDVSGTKFNYSCNKKTVVFDADWIEKKGDFEGRPIVIFAKDNQVSLAIFDEIIVTTKDIN